MVTRNVRDTQNGPESVRSLEKERDQTKYYHEDEMHPSEARSIATDRLRDAHDRWGRKGLGSPREHLCEPVLGGGRGAEARTISELSRSRRRLGSFKCRSQDRYLDL